MIAAANDTFIFVKKASGTPVPMRVSPVTLTRRIGTVSREKSLSAMAKQPRNATPIATQHFTRRERSSARWEVKGICTSAAGPLPRLLLTFFFCDGCWGWRGGVRWSFRGRTILVGGVGGSIFDFVLHLAELVFKLIGGTTKFRHTFAEGACKFWELLGTEHDECQSQNQKQLGHADAEHEPKLFDFMLLIKLSTIAQLPLFPFSQVVTALEVWLFCSVTAQVVALGMARSAVVVDPEYLKHDPGEFHPERPERIKVLLDLADKLDHQRFQILPPMAASRSDIEACHGADYVKLIESTSKTNHYALDGDTITCRDSFGVGLLAVGGFLRLI